MAEGRFGPLAVNVADQRRDPDSLLNWMERLIRRRRETPELGWGTWRCSDDVPERARPPVRLGGADGRGRAQPRRAAVRGAGAAGGRAEGAKLDDLLDERGALHEIEGGSLELKMDGYGYRWFRICRRTITPRRRLPRAHRQPSCSCRYWRHSSP